MKYRLDLNELSTCYPTVILPSKITDSFNEQIHYEKILSFIGETYSCISTRVFHHPQYFTLSGEKKDYSLSEYLDLDRGEYNFILGDFYYSNPFKADYKLPKRPSKYKYEKVEKNNFFLISLNLIINFVLFFILLNYVSFQSSIIALLGLCSLSCVLYYLDFYKQKVSNEVELNQDEYTAVATDFKARVDNVAAKVVSDFIDYKRKKLQIAELHRSEVEIKMYNQLLKPLTVATAKQSESKKGRTEVFFLSKLYDLFGKQIKIDVIPNGLANPYQPDFLLICEKTGFHLVIEIDEPYAVENGKPIHHERTADKKRETFFESINWGIVKFSEKQIIETPEECCLLIKAVLDCVINRKDFCYHNITIEPKWTYEEAILMANKNYRNSYLPPDMQISIQESKNINADDFELPF